MSADQSQFRSLVRKVHRLGPRPVGELLAELAREHPALLPVLSRKLEQYAGFDPDCIATFGASDWLDPAALIRVVPERTGARA